MTQQFQSTNATNQQRWNQVLDRVTLTEESFVYAVRTTGIYCRPGCPSRLPKRENVIFYDMPSDARKAGYRSCKRCHPDQLGVTDPKIASVLEACRYIDRCSTPPTLQELAAAVDVSGSHLHRLFQQLLGVSPKGYAAMKRAARVRQHLRIQKEASITDTVLASGYEANSRFYAESDSILGMLPGQYRSGGKDVTMHLVFAKTSLGLVAIAMTEKGVCSIEFGDNKHDLKADVLQNFPLSRIEPSIAHEHWVNDVIEAIDSPSASTAIPLDIQGTAFQRRVWEAIRDIPIGETRTYTDIANAIDQPTAARAVANACGANRLAVVIPCHRVRRSDGRIGGYRWGESRKIELCRRESQIAGNR